MTALDRICNTLHPAPVRKGDVFWYRLKGPVYGGIVLDVTPEYYFIALSEECSSIPQSTANILALPLYTAAWFSRIDLLPSRQIHKIGTVDITGSFQGRAGLVVSQQGMYLKNCGQRDTWRHTFQSYRIPNCCMKDVLQPSTFRKTFVHS